MPCLAHDAVELIQANIDSRDYHAPWTRPFTDMEGFENWFGQLITGPNFSLVARESHPGVS
jgi:[ribosomal protein S5]-alanine N-acetyltransferase